MKDEERDEEKDEERDEEKIKSKDTKKSDSKKTKKNDSKNMKKNDSKESKKMDKNESKKSASKGSKKAEKESLDRRSKNFPPKMQANLKKYFAREYDVSIAGAAKKFDCSRSVIRYWIKRLNIDYEGYQSSMHWCLNKGNCSFCKKVAAACAKK